MDVILSPLTILFTNVVAAAVFAIVKDVVNHVLRGETQLVLQRLAVTPRPARVDLPHVEISGRRGGFFGYLLVLFDLSPKVSLTGNAHEVRKSSTGLNGHSLDVIPLSESVAVQADSRRSVVWLLAALSSLTVGVGSGLLSGETLMQQLLNALAWVGAAGLYLFAFYQSHRFQITVHGSIPAGVSFKPDLDGRAIAFPQVIEAVETLMERIQESRHLGLSQAAPFAPAGGPAKVRKSPPPLAPVSVPAASPFPQVAAIHDPDETLNEPAFPQTPVGVGADQPERSNTGTVEYGEDQPPFDPPTYWGGPEPGTSDSIQLRQSISRSETGMFLGVPGNGSEYDEEVLDDNDTDSDTGTHRGTVAWEEHADKTQDEMRAEAELEDLKRSRPKRGEAKLRLRELMRRFPQTEAANKARRMLERLEAAS